jgi:hypothetical protein
MNNGPTDICAKTVQRGSRPEEAIPSSDFQDRMSVIISGIHTGSRSYERITEFFVSERCREKEWGPSESISAIESFVRVLSFLC